MPARPSGLASARVGAAARASSSLRPVQDYKGVTDLLAAFAAMPGTTAAQLIVAGQCEDQEVLRARLQTLAREGRPACRTTP